MRLAAALLALTLASPALAAGPGEAQGQGREMRLAGVGGLAFTADLSRDSEEAGIGTWRRELSAAGLSFQWGGLKANATGGLFTYDYASAGQGSAPMTSFAVGHETPLGLGILSLELRQSALWSSDGRLDITSARLSWSLRF